MSHVAHNAVTAHHEESVGQQDPSPAGAMLPLSDEAPVADQVAGLTPDDDSASGEIAEGAILTVEQLARATYARFQPRFREQIDLAAVHAVVASLDLSDVLAVGHAPQLQVCRLRFSGAKGPDMQGNLLPIQYDQTFAPGVNVVLIENNEVGKSSIWKTIKFALTGDDGDYDVDVRIWITDIWLTFSLDGQPFTSLLTRRGAIVRALLVPGEEARSLEEVAADVAIYPIFDKTGLPNIQDELQHFFFNHFGFKPLAWTQEAPQGGGGIGERKTSWLTYFQALLIPDGGDGYLLCDAPHSYGNQDGLILSEYLGLHYADPLNALGVQASKTRKELKQEQHLSESEKQQAEQQRVALEGALAEKRERVASIRRAQLARRRAVEDTQSNRRLLEFQEQFAERLATLAQLNEERDHLTTAITELRGRGRQLREAVILQLHFTGIHVTLCPNCDAQVEEASVVREQETHTCRLCGKPAHAAPHDEIAAMEAEAKACDAQRKEGERNRDAIEREIGQVRQAVDTLNDTIEQAKRAALQGIPYAFPTEEEEADHTQLLTEIGEIQRDLVLARDRLQGRQTEVTTMETQERILEKIRDTLKSVAAQRNGTHLQRLSALTQQMAQQIGAEGITELTCTPLGKVKLLKHGQPVAFTNINNGGERLRLKLAFFLAMMRLGRESAGRHPGFLIVDQPGSNEMVESDFTALAQIFHHIDQEFGDQLQILCFTARSQFAHATDDARIYGPQAAPYAF